jgi:Plasmid pRiA4b ORF-3-like protein
LHRGERFTYVYSFIDHWECALRLEVILPPEPRRLSPVCIGGKRTAPPQSSGGAWAHMHRVDQHRVPLEAMAIVAQARERLLQADGQTTIRQVVGDRGTFREAVAQLDAYPQFQLERFDRRQVNCQLRAIEQQEGAPP